MSTPNRFRNATGNFYLNALFWEMSFPTKDTALYTLKNQDHQGLPSLYRLYMEVDDPTEWQFATQYLDGWEHWELLCECSWFKPYITRWRRELEIRTRARALAKVKDVADGKGQNAYHANKFLLEGGWKPTEGPKKRGAPSKDEIKSAAAAIAASEDRISKDFERIAKH